MAILTDLKARFPNMVTTDIDTYGVLYENNYLMYYNSVYGQNATDDEIILNLFAHLITVAVNTSDGESQKQIGSDNVGSVSTSYVVNALENDDKFWTSTIYGQTYKMLTARNVGSHFV